MKKLAIILGLALWLVIIWWVVRPGERQTEKLINRETKEQITENQVGESDLLEEEFLSSEGEVELVVIAFLDEWAVASPPYNDEEALNVALGKLSQGKVAELAKVSGEYSWISLNEVMGVEKLPEQGWGIGQVEVNDDNAKLSVILKNTEGNTERVFELVEEEGEWRIEGVHEG